MGLGWTWSSVSPSSAYWGSEQADEYVQAQADLHAKTHASKHRGEGFDQRQFADARERFDKIRSQLEGARNARASIGTYLTATGILLALVGIGIHLTNEKPR
jgi:hypothetical protein